jgi:exopolysaccharide biosynthesis WecB/TagA/CpsF family protein
VLTRVEKIVTQNVKHAVGEAKFSIFTINPELVLLAHGDKRLKEEIKKCTFPIAEAVGMAQAAKFISLKTPKNNVLRFFVSILQGVIVGASTFMAPKWLTSDFSYIKGRVLFMNLVKLANKKGWRVFLLGGEGDEAMLAASEIKKKYKDIKILSQKGPILSQTAQPVSKVDRKLYKDTIDSINKFRPHLLFVAFGNPKQEFWIHKNILKLNVTGAMAVGGSFRYLAGISRLPPKWMENFGIEWFLRLLTEPFRFKRIFKAVFVFPIKVFLYKISH